MIKKYLNQKNEELWEVYVCIYSSSSSKRIQKRIKGIKSESLAKKQELQLSRECERELLSRENKDISWIKLIDNYELYIRNDITSELGKHARMDYIATVRKHTQHWSEREVSNISTVEVKQLFNELSGQLSVGHLIKLKMILSRIFKYGVETKQVKNLLILPTSDLKIPKAAEKPPEILSLAEIRKLLNVAKSLEHRWYPIWAVALLTGMRNGEIYALIWDDIDLDNKIITVSKSYNKRTRETKSTKAGYWRHIPISEDLGSLLKQLKLKSNGSKFVLPRIRDWNRGNQASELRAFCLSIGIPSVRFHTLRACFATQLIRQGIPAIQIQKICGWKDLETMQRYIRMAGIEISGVTDNLKIMPDNEVMGEVVQLFGSNK